MCKYQAILTLFNYQGKMTLYMRGKTLKSNVSLPYAYVEVRFESFNEADRLFHQPVNYEEARRVSKIM